MRIPWRAVNTQIADPITVSASAVSGGSCECVPQTAPAAAGAAGLGTPMWELPEVLAHTQPPLSISISTHCPQVTSHDKHSCSQTSSVGAILLIQTGQPIPTSRRPPPPPIWPSLAPISLLGQCQLPSCWSPCYPLDRLESITTRQGDH